MTAPDDAQAVWARSWGPGWPDDDEAARLQRRREMIDDGSLIVHTPAPRPPGPAHGDAGGTEAGAKRHRRAGEKPCADCLEAETAAQRRRAGRRALKVVR